jgi:hypothetical protein
MPTCLVGTAEKTMPRDPEQEISVSVGVRGGPGRTRTGNQTVISSMLQSATAGKLRILGAKHGINDGHRMDWHSAANRALLSSSWGNCLSGILPRRLDAEAGLRW